MGRSCNTSKGNGCAQVSRKLPLRHGWIYRNTACTQRIMCTSVFIAGVCATLIFCHKMAREAQVSLANQAIFLCNQDIRAHTTGCKRGFRWSKYRYYFPFNSEGFIRIRTPHQQVLHNAVNTELMFVTSRKQSLMLP